MNYLNEFHNKTAAWLRELSRAGCIPEAFVDDRSITEVEAEDLVGYKQCHFFAGIAGWCEALRLVRWPKDIEVWTGSPPCQPFSRSGKKKGKSDERHLAPQCLGLVSQRRPLFLAGEQVADAITCGWIDDLQIHLEREGYAVGFVVLPACSVGAPHERKRLFFCAYRLDAPVADRERLAAAARRFQDTPYGLDVADGNANKRTQRRVVPETRRIPRKDRAHQPVAGQPRGAGNALPGSVADSLSPRRERRVPRRASARREDLHRCARRNGAAGSVDNSGSIRRETRGHHYTEHDRVEPAATSKIEFPDPLANEWAGADWLLCKDGKLRAVRSGAFPLADGIPNRVVKLRGLGNAIVPRVAAEFLAAFMLSL